MKKSNEMIPHNPNATALDNGKVNTAFDREPDSKPIYDDNIDEETKILNSKGPAWKSLPVRIRWYVYISHFLSAWGDRMWNFGVGLFLVIISPDSLRVTAVYGLSMGAAVLFLGAHVGDWVDKTPRISAARISLVVQNISVAVCAGIVYVVIRYQPEIQTTWPNEGLLTLSYGLIIAIAIVSTLASNANTIAVERDWIAQICGDDKDMLASTSATLKSIDLITKIVAPIATGQIMAYASPEIGALFIGGWNVVSVFVEYYLLWKVYECVPALKANKDMPRIDTDKVQEVTRTDDLSFTASYNIRQSPPAMTLTKTEEETHPEKDENGSKPTCFQQTFSGVFIFIRGWQTYMKNEAAFAGLALSALFMTVLGFDNVTVGFAYTQGVNESIMGILMAAGAVVGILGTVIYPFLRKRVGLVRTGLFGLFFQVALLSLCVLSVWVPDSPFDLFYWKKETNIDPPSLDFRNVSAALLENTTAVVIDDPENWTNNWNVSNLSIDNSGNMDKINSSTEQITAPESSQTTFISIGFLMAGIIGARCGLWMADLTITQLFIESTVESERGIVFGVQTSLNQLMDMLKFIMVVVAPQPEVFGLLILISYAFVCLGGLLYAKYAHSVRGHLFHFNKLRLIL